MASVGPLLVPGRSKRRASVSVTSAASSRSNVAVTLSFSAPGGVQHLGQLLGGGGQLEVGHVRTQPLIGRSLLTRHPCPWGAGGVVPFVAVTALPAADRGRLGHSG